MSKRVRQDHKPTSWSDILSAAKSLLANSNTDVGTRTLPSLFTFRIHPSTVAQAACILESRDLVACPSGQSSYARYHNNRSKLLDTKMSIAGLNVSFTPPSAACFPSDAPFAGTVADESTFSYAPLHQNRARISFAFVATTSRAIGSPMRFA